MILSLQATKKTKGGLDLAPRLADLWVRLAIFTKKKKRGIWNCCIERHVPFALNVHLIIFNAI